MRSLLLARIELAELAACFVPGRMRAVTKRPWWSRGSISRLI